MLARRKESCMGNETNILVQVDKTVVRITGLSVAGLNIQQLEDLLQAQLQTMTRIIGVTGDSLEMDVYGMSEDAILRDKDGLIQAVSLADGIRVSDVTQLSHVEEICSVDFFHIPPVDPQGCSAERWI